MLVPAKLDHKLKRHPQYGYQYYEYDYTPMYGVSFMDISDALEYFGEDIDGQKALVIPPALYTSIRNTKDWAPASEFAANALVRGSVGRIFGCDIMVSNRLRTSGNGFIVKPGATRMILKRNTLLEADRDILRRVNVYTATMHYVTYLYNAAGAIKLTTK